MTPKIKYTGSIRDADKAIEEYKRRTGYKGGVIAIPKGLELWKQESNVTSQDVDGHKN